MKTISLLFSVVFCATHAPAQVSIALDELIEKHIAAMGGREALERVTSTVMTGSFELPAMRAFGSITIYGKAPNKRMTVIVDDGSTDAYTAARLDALSAERQRGSTCGGNTVKQPCWTATSRCSSDCWRAGAGAGNPCAGGRWPCRRCRRGRPRLRLVACSVWRAMTRARAGFARRRKSTQG